jgi:hypothetical protein
MASGKPGTVQSAFAIKFNTRVGFAPNDVDAHKVMSRLARDSKFGLNLT